MMDQMKQLIYNLRFFSILHILYPLNLFAFRIRILESECDLVGLAMCVMDGIAIRIWSERVKGLCTEQQRWKWKHEKLLRLNLLRSAVCIFIAEVVLRLLVLV